MIKINQNSERIDNIQSLQETPVCIDLTEDNDEEPVTKRIILSNHLGDLVGDLSVNGQSRAFNGPSTSAGNGPTTSKANNDQLGPNRRLLHTCSKCGGIDYRQVTIQLPPCSHALCYTCLVFSLRNNKLAISVCPMLRCKQPLTDVFIKKALTLNDYVAYLEHSRDNLRKALLVSEQGDGKHVKASNVDEGAIDLDVSTDLEEEAVPPEAKCQEVVEIEDLLQAEVQKRKFSEFLHLQTLDAESYVQNREPFECPICFNQLGIGEGVILKNCLHLFCIECLSDTVKHADDPTVICPYNSEQGACEFPIQEREIRGLVSEEIYEKHLSMALKRAETNLENVFHCKLPDCVGFVEHQPDNTAFICPVCEKVNCIVCKTIHEDKTCEQYKDEINTSSRTKEEEQLTEEELKKRVEEGKVSECI